MKASVLLHHLTELGVDVRVRDRRLTIRNAKKLAAWQLQAVATHRDAIRRFLVEGDDAEITPSVTQRELIKLGFTQLETGAWCHVQGDERGDLILLGLIDPDVIEEEQESVRRELIGLGEPLTPKQDVITDLREVRPGHLRWSERADTVYPDPRPKLPREEL